MIRRYVSLFFVLSATFGPALTVVSAGTPQVAGFAETSYADLGTDTGANKGATGLAWAPDDTQRLFVLRKDGIVRVVKGGAVLATPFATISPVFTNSECGLIGVCFDPNFVANGYVYFFVTVASNEQQIIRYTAVGDVGQSKTIIKAGLSTNGANHDGGGLAFGYDGKIYWSIGDGGSNTGVDNDLTKYFAKVSRANPDGTAPVDNPFYLGTGTARDWIWARGFRNPFTMTVQPGTGNITLDVVGSTPGGQTNPNSGPGYEQIFFVTRSSDGGYDDWEGNQNLQPGGIRYAGSPLLFPILQYKTNGSDSTYNATVAAGGIVRSGNLVTFTTTATHKVRRSETVTLSGSTGGFDGRYVIQSVPSGTSFTAASIGADGTGGGGTIAPLSFGGAIGGGTFNDSTLFPSDYRGNFFFADYNAGYVMRMALDASNRASRAEIFLTGSSSVVDVAQGPDGALYYVSAGGSGVIFRLAPTAASQTQEVVLSALNLNLVEGGQGKFTLQLAKAPASDVTVNVQKVSGGGVLSLIDPATGDALPPRVPAPAYCARGIELDNNPQPGLNFTFTAANWNVPQTVTVAVPADADFDPSLSVLQVSAPGIGNYQVNVFASDPDQPNIVVSNGALTINEGGTGSFTVRLASAPASDVTVSVARTSGDTDLSVTGGSSLTFTTGNFATAQTVTISAAEDADTVDDVAVFTVSGPGQGSRTVTVTALDNDNAPPAITSTPVTGAVSGASYTYQVVATGRPVPTFSLTSAPAGMSINSTSGLISWAPVATGPFSVIVHAANGIAPAADQSFTVTVSTDQSPTALITSPSNGQIILGNSAEFFGDGVDDVGCIRATFAIDGVAQPAATDNNTSGHYHFNRQHLSFDTTGLSNGPHLLRLTVTDTKGQTGFREVDVIVSNNPTPAEAWRFQYFTPAELRAGVITTDNADPDNDGISNKLERFLNLNPRQNDKSGLPVVGTTVDGRVQIAFDRAVAATDLSFVVEVSDDLQTWLFGPTNTETISDLDQGATRRITVAARTGAGLPNFRFIRLRVN